MTRGGVPTPGKPSQASPLRRSEGVLQPERLTPGLGEEQLSGSASAALRLILYFLFLADVCGRLVVLGVVVGS